MNIHLEKYLRAADKLNLRYETLSVNVAAFTYRSHRFLIDGAVSPLNPSSSYRIAQNKGRAQSLLAENAHPVPEAIICTDRQAFDDACKRMSGRPFVVKPVDGNGGRGVTIKPTTQTEIEIAYNFALSESVKKHVMVEEYVEGEHYRVFIVDGVMVASAKREPAKITGDGISTIGELIETNNRLIDPNHKTANAIPLDDELHLCLSEQNYTLETIPGRLETVYVRRNCNLSTGGTTYGATHLMTDEAVSVAVKAAEFLGLRVAGVDLIIKDDGSIYINEVNSNPGLRIHYHLTAGEVIDVAYYILKTMMMEFDRQDLQALATPETAFNDIEMLERLTDTADDSL